ncbi:MAG: DNA mismatch repair protein MutS [Chloroflexi bacterium]|nr:MAG: DNA mismatch repair protein MutS [Chloroflexota bacterium]
MSTPIRRQYLAIKRQYPDVIVFFRLGDFYETFDADAELVADVLDITLTSREMGRGNRVPMAGIPYHAAEGYISRLLAAGHKVAIAEQIGKANGTELIERKVTSVVTPGTTNDPAFLRGNVASYIVALVSDAERAGIAYADVSTGEFATTQLTAGNTHDLHEAVRRELMRLQPVEALFRPSEPLQAVLEPEVHRSNLPELAWRVDTTRESLLEHFEVTTLEPFGCEREPLATRAAGALLAYIQQTQPVAARNIRSLHTYAVSRFMTLDAQTRRNLELHRSTARDGGPTLQQTMDATRTPLGHRLLQRWIGQPLLEREAIERRLDGVAIFVDDALLRARLRETLHGIGDLERIANRVAARQVQPRELLALRETLHRLPRVAGLLQAAGAPLAELRLPVSEGAASELNAAIVDDPPAVFSGGGAIKPGYSPELDSLRATLARDRAYIADLERTERERTGIKSLRVGYTKVFGYYLEISNVHRELVPADYDRKQTLVNAERYVTAELKAAESRVLAAEERISAAEADAWARLLDRLAVHVHDFLTAAAAIAELDTLSALAEIAATRGYVRPEICDDDVLEIEDGRHPVVERQLERGAFVPNDTRLSDADGRIAILTGPNMSGKSTYLRQVALIVLLAQIGSYVPARRARVGIVDRIFTRIGAHDDLASGQSTFMVEMLETATILNHATARSLVVLDEIGRGTSTYDGLAIATAIVEYLHNTPRLCCRTLFATHYHELTALADVLPRVRNYRVDVLESGDRITFLHKVVPGGADRSYGVYVAQIAGMPKAVVRRASEVLRELEQDAASAERTRRRGQVLSEPVAGPTQLTLFGITHPAVERLRSLEVDALSPLEALQTLYELGRLARDN